MNMDSIKKTARTCTEILDFVIPLVVSAINAPAEVIDIRIQLEALSQSINSFLSEASSEDSILSTFGSKQLAGLGGLLQRLDSNLSLVQKNIKQYIVILPTSQRKAWNDTFSSMIYRLKWTWNGAGVKDLVGQLRSDCELINNLVVVIQM
jgi:hypothetical protein